MAPVVDGLKGQYEGKVEFKLYDVEKDKEGGRLADSLGLQYVPTFVFVSSDGSIAQKVVGEMTEARMREILDSLK
ncbi:MAG: thioredoxin family protein [Anaerosomatales bacterium]|nr:thioredoxin family protein [Anaerosomatales bacterium]MDI6843210.1 thioredoxin family protein [Anaerosomatales bacterium]